MLYHPKGQSCQAARYIASESATSRNRAELIHMLDSMLHAGWHYTVFKNYIVLVKLDDADAETERHRIEDNTWLTISEEGVVVVVSNEKFHKLYEAGS